VNCVFALLNLKVRWPWGQSREGGWKVPRYGVEMLIVSYWSKDCNWTVCG